MRRSTIVILLVFVLIAGMYYYINNRPEPAQIEVTLEPAEPTESIEYLFNAADGLATGIRIEGQDGSAVEVIRNAEAVWEVKLPIEGAADQGSVEAAASQLATVRILDRLSAAVKPADVGLESPEYTLTLTFAGDVERKANIGVMTPSESGYYAQLVGSNEIIMVSRSAIDALIGLLAAPPYVAETPVPTP
jgi:hypothetical protein